MTLDRIGLGRALVALAALPAYTGENRWWQVGRPATTSGKGESPNRTLQVVERSPTSAPARDQVWNWGPVAGIDVDHPDEGTPSPGLCGRGPGEHDSPPVRYQPFNRPGISLRRSFPPGGRIPEWPHREVCE